nr:unnamed protein product [Sorex araneus]
MPSELHKRTDIIRSLTKKVKSLESNQNECQAALQKTQLQLQEMAQKATHSSLLSEDLEIYVKQQSDLQFLNFNVENSQELIQIYDSKMEGPKTLEFSRDMCLSDLEIVHPKVDLKRDRNQKPLMKEQKLESVLIQQTQLDKNTCDVCKEKKQFDSTPGGKSVAAVGSLLTTDLAEKPKACCLGGRLQSEPLCAVHAQPLLSPRAGPPGEEKQPWGPLSAEQHWHDVSVYLGLADCSASKQPDRPGGACRDPGEGAGVSGCSLRGACAGAREACEAHCCHPRNIVIEAPGHMSDVEWMSIFKPSKVQRIVRHKSVCTCSGSGVGTKYNNCTSELTPVPHGLAGGSSQLASRGDEKPGDTEAACDGSSSPKLLPSGLDAATPCGKCPLMSPQDDSSPTSKLQRLLAESRQMVSDLELSTLLPVGAERPGSATQKAISISKAINTQEGPVKEKHARLVDLGRGPSPLPGRLLPPACSDPALALTRVGIILGTHHEKGAFTFWAYAIGLPLPSSSVLSWKFCHVLHKVLRDGHPNVLQDCQRYRSNIREIGDLWAHLHDRYGQLVSVYTKLLLTKISFHTKHPQFPAGLEVTDEVLEKAAGTDVNNM